MTEMSEDLRGKQSPCTLIKVFFLGLFDFAYSKLKLLESRSIEPGTSGGTQSSTPRVQVFEGEKSS